MNNYEGTSPTKNKEHDSFDICIMGGGLSELLLGCRIAEKEPHRSVCIIDSEIVSCGNSAKDSGFGTRFSFSQFADECGRIGVGRAINRLRSRLAGLSSLLRQIDSGAGLADCCGSYEIVTGKNIYLLNYLDKINQILYGVFNQNIFEIRNEKIREFGMNDKLVQALIFNRLEWQLNTGKILSTLMQRFQRFGGRYITGFEVVDCRVESLSGYPNQFIEKMNSEPNKKVELKVRSRGDGERVGSLSCSEFICCERSAQEPSYCMVTLPIPNLAFSTSFYLNEPSCYVRTIGERILVEVTKSNIQESTANEKAQMVSLIGTLFPNIEMKPDCFWQIETQNRDKKLMGRKGVVRISDSVFWIGKGSMNGIGEELKLADRAYHALFERKAKI